MPGLGRKVFTAGDVLTASDVQNYLMDQTTMVFAGTAARSSAIATPTTGMTSYIGTTGTASIPQIETYTGSAWQTPYGLTQVANVSFTTISSVQIDNVFTSAFDHYFLNFTLTACTGNDTFVQLKLVDGTTPTTTNDYYWATSGVISSTAGAVTNVGNAQNSLLVARMSSSAADVTEFSMNILAPTKANRTSFNWLCFNFNGAISFNYAGSGNFNLATQFEGLQFLAGTGTMSGNVKIYGYRNS